MSGNFTFYCARLHLHEQQVVLIMGGLYESFGVLVSMSSWGVAGPVLLIPSICSHALCTLYLHPVSVN